MRRALITALTAAGLLALGGAAYAGTTGYPDDDCARGVIAVCSDINPTTLIDLQ